MKYLLPVSLFLMLLLGACEIKDFNVPVWDVDLHVPLINDLFYVSDLVDSVNIITDDGDLMHLVSSGELGTPNMMSVSMNPGIDISGIPMLSGVQGTISVPLLDTNDNVDISYGRISNGILRYQFSSVSPNVESINVTLHDFKDSAGNPLVMEYTTTDEVVMDLTNYSLGTLNSTHTLDSLQITLACVSSLAQGTPVAEFGLQLNDEIEFDLFQGKINHLEMIAEDPSVEMNIDYPYDLDQAITLSEANLVVNITNDVGFEVEFVGSFEARRNDQIRRVPIKDDNGNNYRIPAANGNTPGTATLVLHDNISSLLQIMPTHIKVVDAGFIIDSASGIGSIAASDDIIAQYTISAPFIFTPHANPMEVDSVRVIEISQENRDRIKRNVREASLQLSAKNRLPIGATVYAYFGTSANLNTNDPDTYRFMKSVNISSANLDSDWQELEGLSLSYDEMQLFSEAQVYLKWKFSLEESATNVEIHGGTDDYIAIRGSIAAKIRVEEEE